MPDEDTKQFVTTHPVKLLAGKELKALFAEENPPGENIETMPTSASDVSLPCSPGDTTISSNKPSAANNNPAKNVKTAGQAAKSPGNTQDTSATSLRMRMR